MSWLIGCTSALLFATEEPFVDAIRTLFRNGLSIREVSRRTGKPYTAVRSHLIRAGVLRVRLTRVRDGMAPCNVCGEDKSVDEFPALLMGKYQCRSCLNKANHLQQLQKMKCAPDQFEALLQGQDRKCAICGASQGHRSHRGKTCRLAVDHDHQTGEVRGLLCNNCNRGLGRFEDSVENLETAVRYLKQKQSASRKS